MLKVFLAGYQGHRADELRRAAEFLGAVVVDIRYEASSMNPDWHYKALRLSLGPGRYWPVREWGNVNYRFPNAPIVISSFKLGLECVQGIKHPMILLCRCPHARTCHRRVVGDRLQAIGGFSVQELDWQIGLVGSLFECGMDSA